MTPPVSDRDRFEAGRESVERYRQTPALLTALELAAFQDAGPYAVALRRSLLGLGAPPLPRLFGRLAGQGPWGLRWRRFHRDYEFWRGVRAAIRDGETWDALIRAPVMLMYHAIGRPGERASRFIVPLRRFERQMAWLDSRGYRIMGLGELLECRRRHTLPPARSVVITFDDGYADNHALALPVLQARRFPATFFLVSGAVGGTNAWDAGGELAGRALMSWEQAAELLRHGMAVGSHTRSHPVVPGLSPADRERRAAGRSTGPGAGAGPADRHLRLPVRPDGRRDGHRRRAGRLRSGVLQPFRRQRSGRLPVCPPAARGPRHRFDGEVRPQPARRPPPPTGADGMKSHAPITVAIASCDRPAALVRCVEGVLAGEVLPHEVLVVDQSRDAAGGAGRGGHGDAAGARAGRRGSPGRDCRRPGTKRSGSPTSRS